MPPIDRFRELLGPNNDLDDEELKMLREHIQNLAELIVDLAFDTLIGSTVPEQGSRIEGKPEVN